MAIDYALQHDAKEVAELLQVFLVFFCNFSFLFLVWFFFFLLCMHQQPSARIPSKGDVVDVAASNGSLGDDPVKAVLAAIAAKKVAPFAALMESLPNRMAILNTRFEVVVFHFLNNLVMFNAIYGGYRMMAARC
jgi:hypothetical protein